MQGSVYNHNFENEGTVLLRGKSAEDVYNAFRLP
jgi:hypothetical protein